MGPFRFDRCDDRLSSQSPNHLNGVSTFSSFSLHDFSANMETIRRLFEMTNQMMYDNEFFQVHRSNKIDVERFEFTFEIVFLSFIHDRITLFRVQRCIKKKRKNQTTGSLELQLDLTCQHMTNRSK